LGELTWLKLRKSEERGYAIMAGLKSHHSFALPITYDPDHMGWGNLRVINEDVIEPRTGFGKHSHRDMENHQLRTFRRACASRQHGEHQRQFRPEMCSA